MSTFAQMQAKIADDLNRSDLTSQIQREINRAIRRYSKEPFWFNSTQFSFLTVIGQQTYGVADGLPGDIRSVEYLRVNQSGPEILAETGIADAYVLTPAPPITSYSSGLAYRFTATNSNTGASTLNVSGVGAVAIQQLNGDALVAGDIVVGNLISVYYNGSVWQLRPSGSNYYGLTVCAIDQILTWNVDDDNSLPLQYAWFQEKIFLYPNPDQIYEMTVYYNKYYADLVAAGDTNAFTTNPEAEQLIEQEVEFQLYDTIILDDAMAAKCKANRNECLAYVRETTTPFLSVDGAIRATYF